MPQLLRTFGFSAAATAVIWAAVAVGLGWTGLFAVIVLTVLEITFSFDNAVVNAKLLGFLSPWWQRFFMTVGILIAVFVVRFALPVLIVSLTSGLGFSQVLNLAVHDPDRYAAELTKAEPAINSFGGVFLLLIAAGFFLDAAKDVHWFRWLEHKLAFLGRYDNIAFFVLTLVTLGIAVTVDGDERLMVLIAGVAGIALNLGLGIFGAVVDGEEEEDDFYEWDEPVEEVRAAFDRGEKHLTQPSDAEWGRIITDAINRDAMEVTRLREAREQARTGQTIPLGMLDRATYLVGLAAFMMFLRLEVLDASFSFDGVIGAFAISTSVIIIMAGLGAGALWVRSLTVHLVRAGTLAKYRYLEHGAHWAIGALGAVMLVKLYHVHLPEWAIGSIGLVFILFAVVSSVRHQRLTGAST